MRKLPEGPSMSRAHIPFGKIGFWPDRQTTDTDRHRTNKEIRALLYNSPFGAIKCVNEIQLFPEKFVNEMRLFSNRMMVNEL